MRRGNTEVILAIGGSAAEKTRRPVYGDTPGAELRLITCGGSFDRRSGHYRDNVVAYAHLV